MSVLHPSPVRQEKRDFAQATPRQDAPFPAGQPLSASMREFLGWLAQRPRTYGETMEAWRTSCPRNSVWEDAINADLVQLDSDERDTVEHAIVSLTRLGESALRGT